MTTATVPVKVTSKVKEGSEVFEGQVTLPGLKPTKVVRKSDGTTCFASRRALLTSARNTVKKLGFQGVEEATAAKSRR